MLEHKGSNVILHLQMERSKLTDVQFQNLPETPEDQLLFLIQSTSLWFPPSFVPPDLVAQGTLTRTQGWFCEIRSRVSPGIPDSDLTFPSASFSLQDKLFSPLHSFFCIQCFLALG